VALTDAEANKERLKQARRKREVLIDSLLVRMHLIIEMIWWTGLAPWECELSLPGSLIPTFQTQVPLTEKEAKKERLKQARILREANQLLT